MCRLVWISEYCCYGWPAEKSNKCGGLLVTPDWDHVIFSTRDSYLEVGRADNLKLSGVRMWRSVKVPAHCYFDWFIGWFWVSGINIYMFTLKQIYGIICSSLFFSFTAHLLHASVLKYQRGVQRDRGRWKPEDLMETFSKENTLKVFSPF